MKRFSLLICTFLALLLLVTEATQAQTKAHRAVKKKKKDKEMSALGYAYHDMTARYNGYFNAKIIMQESMKKLKVAQTDNFDELLNLFTFEGGEKAAAVHGEMGRVIRKSTVDLQLHPNSKWADDCYLLLGKAYYLKGDYDSALTALQVVGKKFKNSIRIYDRQKVTKGGRKRGMPGLGAGVSVQGPGGISKQERLDLFKKKEKDKKEKAKEREDAQEAREDANKEKKEQMQEEREDREKEREQKAEDKKKQMEKERKEREKARKERAKEKKEEMKEREKARKKGIKYVPKNKSEDKEDADEKEALEEKERQEKEAAEAAEKEREEKEQLAREEEERLAKEKEAAEAAEKERLAREEEERLAREEEERLAKEKEAAEAPETGRSSGVRSSIFAHRPARYEAVLWLARTYLQQDQAAEALTVLNSAREMSGFPRKLLGELNSLYAMYYLKVENAEEAKNALAQSIRTQRKKSQRARLHYILGQMYLAEGNYAEAVTAFNQTLKSKPVYPIEFNAKMNIAKSKLQSGDFSAEQATRYLAKMMKDDKNAEYKDQILFAMAEIAAANGDEARASELLQASAANSKGNNQQKGTSFLKLAEMAYNGRQFEKSAAYYDSALTYLPKDYAKLAEIQDRAKVLVELGKHIKTIEAEDSMQRIARLPKGERDEMLDKLIVELEAAAARALAQTQAANNAAAANNAGADGTWYFYNATQKSLGFTTFQTNWGNRTLSDNWRRSAAATTDLAEPDNEGGEGNLSSLAESGRLRREDLMKMLPTTPERLAASDKRIEEALFAGANIYKDFLSSPPKAIEMYETLIKRFPQSEYLPQVYYTLYLLYGKTDTKKADSYKNKLLAEYPNSEYAKLINNPALADKSVTLDKELLKYYEQTYKMYEEEKYKEVLSRREESQKLFASNDMQPQFDLLSAFAIGKLEGREKYIAALEDVSQKHKGTPAKVKADEMLAYLRNEKSSPANAPKYAYKPEGEHYIAIAFIDYTKPISTYLNQISEFNKSKSMELRTNQLLLSATMPLILIKTFPSAQAAQEHLAMLKEAKKDMFGSISAQYETVLISKENYSIFFEQKDMDAYKTFYTENYGDR
ncbi:MAG: tetratricopeptide repeat protein [Sphingobacteriales bacterium]|nr:tetratricopeptide repeat protein [Sphingobacteriales bacterium]